MYRLMLVADASRSSQVNQIIITLSFSALTKTMIEGGRREILSLETNINRHQKKEVLYLISNNLNVLAVDENG